MPRTQRAFTLIELLVVIAIVAILAAMLLPVISMVKASALSSRCSAQFRQVGMAALCYAGDWDGFIPWSFMQGCAMTEAGYAAGADGAWCDDLMAGSYLDGNGQSVMGGVIAASSPLHGGIWRCPVDRTRKGSSKARGTSYGLNAQFAPFTLGPVTPGFFAGCRSLGRLKQSSATVLGAESLESRWAWYVDAPIDWPVVPFRDQATETPVWSLGMAKPYQTWARHRRGTNALFADGHLEWRGEMTAAVSAGSLFIRLSDWP
ncbi:MAG: type II secretion system GspH family protein [Planctomycetes bacterium]|nr:type II secretion system GspH family protein [Planctomycetota bacterium]